MVLNKWVIMASALAIIGTSGGGYAIVAQDQETNSSEAVLAEETSPEPTSIPTVEPTATPVPTVKPVLKTPAPTAQPTAAPTVAPTPQPTSGCTQNSNGGSNCTVVNNKDVNLREGMVQVNVPNPPKDEPKESSENTVNVPNNPGGNAIMTIQNSHQ